MTKKPTKTTSLSLRLDPKTRFVLDYIVRQSGMNQTAVIENALKEFAGKFYVQQMDMDPTGWTDYWDPEEGVRSIKLVQDTEINTTYEENELKRFISAHQHFFYNYDPKIKGFVEINIANVTVLWATIDEYMDIWRSSKSTDYYKTAKRMREDLQAAGLDMPDVKFVAPPAIEDDIDEEIPF